MDEYNVIGTLRDRIKILSTKSEQAKVMIRCDSI